MAAFHTRTFRSAPLVTSWPPSGVKSTISAEFLGSSPRAKSRVSAAGGGGSGAGAGGASGPGTTGVLRAPVRRPAAPDSSARRPWEPAPARRSAPPASSTPRPTAASSRPILGFGFAPASTPAGAGALAGAASFAVCPALMASVAFAACSIPVCRAALATAAVRFPVDWFTPATASGGSRPDCAGAELRVRHERQQVPHHVGGRLVAVGRILRHHPADDRRQLGRHVPADGVRRRGRAQRCATSLAVVVPVNGVCPVVRW